MTLVQESFAKVAPSSGAAAGLCDDRLFDLAPNTRTLFTDDMTEQKRILMATLQVVVTSLRRRHEIVPAVQALCRRHASYGMADTDDNTVGAALLWTVAQGLGEGFTQDVREAWVAADGLLSTTMQAAAHSS